jgi:hypothetical protein
MIAFPPATRYIEPKLSEALLAFTGGAIRRRSSIRHSGKQDARMTEQLYGRLRPVQRRQQWLFVLRTAAAGLLIGSCLAALVAAGRLWGLPAPGWSVWAMAAGGLVLGAATGALLRRSWKDAAVAVDARYQLKDRAETALAFLIDPRAGELHHLQVADALEHLDKIDPREVAPYRTPRTLLWAGAALAAAVVLALIPLRSERASAALAPPPAEVLAESERLEKTMLEELKELAKEHQDERLEELAAELEELVEEMQEPGVDGREALAKLSEMQAAIVAAQAEYNVEAVDAQLQELAEALSPAQATQAASQALADGDYSKAADELEKLDASQLSRRESRTLAENLRRLAESMKNANQGKLSEATSQLCEGLESNNPSQCKGGACQLAGMCRNQGMRKGISQCLGNQLSLLAECKGACQGACNGEKNGGSSVAKSDTPKNTWGTGASGQPLGDQATSIDGSRERKDVAGVHGDGPSEKQVFQSAEARQEAARGYRERYEEYRKMNEAVLDSEPLPLGHRQTIRRYFELIRPENADLDGVE